MGIRCDQHIGLTPRALQMVTQPIEVRLVGKRIYPDGKEEPFDEIRKENLIKQVPSGKHYVGMFDEEFPLQKYIFPDGTWMEEYVQDAPWSSGPMWFLALKDQNGTPVVGSLWKAGEI